MYTCVLRVEVRIYIVAISARTLLVLAFSPTSKRLSKRLSARHHVRVSFSRASFLQMKAVSPSASKSTLACEAAEDVRAKHSRGIRVVPLTDLGVAPFNRSISPKYVHYLFRRFLEKEGFTRFRYKYAIALEANPECPLAVAVASRDAHQQRYV